MAIGYKPIRPCRLKRAKFFLSLLKVMKTTPEADILKTIILVWVPLPTFGVPTSHSKMSGLEIFPYPTCEVKESGDCECLHPISHMASEKWEVGLKQEFPFLKYPTRFWGCLTEILRHGAVWG